MGTWPCVGQWYRLGGHLALCRTVVQAGWAPGDKELCVGQWYRLGGHLAVYRTVVQAGWAPGCV